ncbi:helix-turn-helix domain-containing protein [Lysinibacillus sphaericus]|uniref:helix-turn-helix domain-containing protein n=1 Tax=Lysinibacillus sphaericus TaxID=1421 RepID=UPI001A9D2158|nr:helix-turn-helix domain-containing protein [Lysinibacillus sphaericus]QTB25556.1 helix-turn-helix domain-containing protein [Lysinibacillus sphaericus]
MENNLVRDMREAHGLTVREFAVKIGVTPATVISAEKSEFITQKMKANVMRFFDLDDVFFEYVEKRRKLMIYENEGGRSMLIF